MAELKPIQITVALLLATGATITAAAEKAAITRQTIHQWLNSDYEFMAYINRLKKENTEAAKSAIQSAAVLAVETIASIMRDSENDAVRLSAAKEVLAMAGLTKASAIGSDSADELKKARVEKAVFDAMFD